MDARGQELLVGTICLVVAVLLVLRIGRGLRTGELPLYKARRTRAEAGEARFRILLLVNVALFVGMSVIAADLLLGLGLRQR